MPNEAISKLVLTDHEKRYAQSVIDASVNSPLVLKIFTTALALSKAVEDGTVLYTGDRLSSRIVIELPIEGDAQ